MLFSHFKRLRAPRLLQKRRWLKDQSGITAIEFAFVAAPFFLIIIATIEICIVFVIATVLEYGAQEAARTIRTGNFQSGDDVSVSQFEANICERMANLFDCQNTISVDLRTESSFPNAEDVVPLNDDGTLDTDAMGFDPGGRNDIVVVNVYYRWRVVTPLMAGFLANMPNDEILLISAQAFRNEPF